jgi:hypothetical protein
MKKLLVLSIALISSLALFAHEKSLSGAVPEIKTALGDNKDLVNLYTITLPYSAENIKTALHARLKTEGIKGKKSKNNFYAFKGVKYTLLWDNTCDIYVSITGNKETGNVNLVISQGYDNYIDPYQDTVTTKKAFKWLRGVDRVVYEYVHNQTLATHQKEQKEIEKTLSKLESQQKKLESKIKKVENKQRKLEATRTIVDENDLNVDSKKIAKEQELALELQNEYLELNSELKSLTIKIKDTREDLNQKKKAIAEFKHNKK